jgi:GNAT superfamily N-acetyltransferase
MAQKITAKKMKSISRFIRETLEQPRTEFDPMEHPFVVSAAYFPGDIPIDHELTENHDVRCYSEAARNGWWEINVLNVDDPYLPAARAAFSEKEGKVVVERLSVEPEYRGFGFGKQMIELGSRLWGGPVDGVETFDTQNEFFWNSPLADEMA